MRREVRLTGDELDFLLRLNNCFEIIGAYKVGNKTQISDGLLQKMIDNNILIKGIDDNIILESFVELALHTAVNPDFILECLKEEKKNCSFFNIYIHSKTIVILYKSSENDEFSFIWMPSLQLTIGALMNNFKDLPMSCRTVDSITFTTTNNNQLNTNKNIIDWIRLQGMTEINEIIDKIDANNITTITGIKFNNDQVTESNLELNLLLLNTNNNYYLINKKSNTIYWKEIDKIQLIHTVIQGLAYNYFNCLRKVEN